MQKIKKKIIVIGLPKTGLTSLLFSLKRLGYDAHGTNKHVLRAYLNDDLGTTYDYLDRYEALLDWPVQLVYKMAFRRYRSDALYILSLRRSPDAWVESLKRHSLQAHPLKTWFPKLFGYRWPHGFEDQFKAFYEAYNTDAVSFFKENDASPQLLTFCSEEGDSWPEICRFIGRDIPEDTPFPKADVSSERSPQRFRVFCNKIGSKAYSIAAPRIKAGKPIYLP